MSRETAMAAGCYTASKPSEIPPEFSPHQRRRGAALVVAHLSPDGETFGWQTHPDHPGKNKKGRVMKWVSPPGERCRPVLCVHPWTADEARTGTGPLWMPEGITRMWALAERGIAAVSYAGAWTWQKDKVALECFDHLNLDGRLVYDVPDADYRTNTGVQKALALRVAFLESRGATVLVVSVPEVNGDPHAGLDDFIAAGGDLDELVRNAAPFERVDVGVERLSRDERLRAFVGAKLREVDELPARKVGECSAVKVARYVVEVSAPAHGKMRGGLVHVHPSLPQIAEGTGIGSYQTVRKDLDRLEAVGFLKRERERERGPRGTNDATSYALLYPRGGCAQGVNIEGRGVAGKESLEHRGEKETPHKQRDSSLGLHPTHIGTHIGTQTGPDGKGLRLRSPKLVHTFEYRGSKKVVVDSEYFWRYGPKRELIIRHVLERGSVEHAELHEKFGSRTSRPGRFFDTWVKPIFDDGVFVGDPVQMAPDWREALERVKARTDEVGDAKRQREKYAERRRKRRLRLEGEKRGTVPKPERVPELAGPERVKEIFAADAKRDHAARVEEQRRKVGTTAETFIADYLEGVCGFGWRELSRAWSEKGGRSEALRAGVKTGPYRFRRDDYERLYVERTEAEVLQMRPDRGEEASVRSDTELPNQRLSPFLNNPMHARSTLINVDTVEAPRKMPPSVGGVFVHGPECACWICADEPVEAPVRAEIGATA